MNFSLSSETKKSLSSNRGGASRRGRGGRKSLPPGTADQSPSEGTSSTSTTEENSSHENSTDLRPTENNPTHLERKQRDVSQYASQLRDNLASLFLHTLSDKVFPSQLDPAPIFRAASSLCRELRYRELKPTMWKLTKWYIKTRRVEIRKGEEGFARKYELDAFFSTDSLSAHPHSRIARFAADRALWELAINQVKKLGLTSVNDFYGSNRHKFVALHLSKLFVKSRFGDSLVPYTWFRPLITAKDYVTYQAHLKELPSTDPTPQSFVMIQDVYNLDPKDLLDRLDAYGVRVGAICVMIHDRRVLAGMMFKEGPYYQNQGLFHCAPGPGELPWVPSPSNDFWITQSSCLLDSGRVAVWSFHREFGDYKIFVFNVVDTEILNPPISDIPLPSSALLIEKDFPLPTTFLDKVYFSILRMIGQPLDKLTVFLPALESLGASMVGKTRQVYQVSQLSNAVEKLLNEPDYVSFWKFIPIDKAKVLRDTVTYITWSGFSSDYYLIEKLASIFGSSVAAYKTFKNKMVNDTNGYFTLPILRSLMIMFGWFIAYRYVAARFPIFSWIFGRVTSTKQTISSFSPPIDTSGPLQYLLTGLAPAFEEPLKERFGSAWIAVTESVICWLHPDLQLTYGNKQMYYAIFATTYKFLAHKLLGKLPRVFHSCVNVVAMALAQPDQGTEEWYARTAAHTVLSIFLTNLPIPKVARSVFRSMHRKCMLDFLGCCSCTPRSCGFSK